MEVGVGQKILLLDSEHRSPESVLGQIGATMSHPGEHTVAWGAEWDLPGRGTKMD